MKRNLNEWQEWAKKLGYPRPNVVWDILDDWEETIQLILEEVKKPVQWGKDETTDNG